MPHNLLLSILSSLRQGIIVVTPEREVLFTNPLFCDLVFPEFKAEELMGKNGAVLVKGFKEKFMEPDLFADRILEIYESGQPVIGEIIRMRDGRMLTRDYTPLYQDDRLLAHVWTYQLAEIEKQRHFYEQILNNIPADIAVFDKDHRYLFVNPQGIRSPEIRSWIIGKTDEEYCDMRNRPYTIFHERRAAFNRAAETKRQAEWEEQLKTAEGKLEYHYRKMFPVLDEQGKVELVIGYGMNVTTIKEAQTVLEKAREEAEANAQAKEAFLARVSHELRTPMNGILGLADLMERTSLDPKQYQYIKLLRQSAKSLVALVNEVLDIEKIGSGKMELHPEVFHLSDRMQALLDLFTETAQGKGLTLDLEVESGLPDSFRGDINRIVQVLGNLLSNAIKFTDSGSVTLQVGAAAHGMIRFQVVDTGIGIEPESLERIFEPFVQARSSGQLNRPGTGLGLTICKELAEVMGGRIEVESVPDKGSTFRFILPLETVDDVLETNAQENTRSSGDLLVGKRILLVEDVPLNRFLVEEMTRDWGIVLETAVDGSVGVQRVTQKQFDLVLMDIQMPVMDGVQATRAIRSLPDASRAAVPIVALSANAFESDRLKYLEAGMNDALSKPFDADTLRNVIMNLLQLAQDQGPAPVQRSTSDGLQIDLSYLNRVGHGNPAFVQTMLRSFVDSVKEASSDMLTALEADDRKAIGEAAHKLKFALGVVGVIVLKDTVAFLEEQGKGDVARAETTTYRSTVLRFVRQLDALQAEIINLLEN